MSCLLATNKTIYFASKSRRCVRRHLEAASRKNIMSTTNKTNYLPTEMLREIMSNLDETKKLKAENDKLKTENEKLKEKNNKLVYLLEELINEEKAIEEIAKCEVCGEFGDALSYDFNDDIGFHCCQNKKCLRKFWGD